MSMDKSSLATVCVERTHFTQVWTFFGQTVKVFEAGFVPLGFSRATSSKGVPAADDQRRQTILSQNHFLNFQMRAEITYLQPFHRCKQPVNQRTSPYH